jgi:hypothetical protein
MRCAVRRGTLALAFIVLPFVVSADPASADAITGGCSGTVNGKDGAILTKDKPLVVREGAQVEITGNVPAAFAAQNPTSNTTVKISVIDGLISLTSDKQESTGPTYSANDVNVDDYFNAGVGLYRIDIENTGVGWDCKYTAYIQLEGDTLSGPAGLIGLGAIIAGAVGAFLMKGRKPKDPGWIDAGLGTADQIAREEAWQAAGREHLDAVSFEERATHLLAPPRGLQPNEREIWTGKVRHRGRAVAGFFWGLLLGIGIGIFGWQDARWTLNLGSIILLPLVVAALAGFFAWWGWGYRIRDVVVLPAAAVPPPPETASAANDLAVADDPLAHDPLLENGAADKADKPTVSSFDPEHTPDV